MKKGIYIKDSIHGLILLSEYEKRIISSVGFNRLHDVYQNSTVYLTFPTNRTKRFEHSIGTMKLCSDMFYTSVLNSSEKCLEDFYSLFLKEYENIISSISEECSFWDSKLGGITPQKIPYIKFDKFRHSLVPHNVPKQYEIVHLLLIQSVRVAGLLHDIGHPPFSHIVEYALKAAYDQNKLKNECTSERAEKFLNTMSKYFDGDKKLHEQMGDEISSSIMKEVIKNITAEDSDEYEENLFELLIQISVEKIFQNKPNFLYLHKIVDGSLDGDRLDYVTRDSLNSGIDSGKIDYNRIIDDMQLIIKDNEICFCIPIKAVNSVEDFIKRRFNIYKNIIYHHRVIKMDYLLEYTVRDLINQYLYEDVPFEQETSNQFVIPFDISGLWFPLGNSTSAEKANALSQWNDSWLMTILKQIYYTEYYRKVSLSDSKKYTLQQRLSELLCNKKNYYSLIKRSENFRLIDNKVKEVIEKNKVSVKALIQNMINLSQEKQWNKIETTTVDMGGTTRFLEGIFQNTNCQTNDFILAAFAKNYKAIRITSFKDFISKIVEAEIKKFLKHDNCYDVITVFKNISIGLEQSICFYDREEHIYTLDQISGVRNVLQLESDYLPVFYIYVLIRDGDDYIRKNRTSILELIGQKIGELLIQTIITNLEAEINKLEE